MATCDVSKAAALLCVHPRTIFDLIHAGAIPAAKIGRAFVMLEKDIMDYLENQVVRQTAARMRSPQLSGKVARP